MNTNPKPADRRSRGLILTEEALTLLDRELSVQWEKSKARRQSSTGKMTRVDRGVLLGIEAKTADKIYRREPVDEVTLRHVFEKLNITPRFSIAQHCVSDAPPSGNLPNVSTRCIGRETEVIEIQELVQSHSLVTLVGAGGVGKTRLAIQVAEEMKSHYPASVWFVKLAEVSDPALVLQMVASTLGVQEKQDRPLLQALSDFLLGKPLLLILDNCEHLLDACATLTNRLLSSAPTLTVLATSRERLNISFERPYRVPSLSIPDLKRLSGEKDDRAQLVQDSDSVRLFVERARLQCDDFNVTDQNAPLLASICHRLDGIPLALELAAARVRAMPLDELERGLNDCFRLLTGGHRTALPRHQTLRATMDWSFGLLEEQERALLRRLSVFAGGGSREAAEQICSGAEVEEWEVLDLLTSLVDKSLLVYEEREGQARYRLLETVRQYGRDQLQKSGESDAIQRRHRDYFLKLAEAVDPQLKGREAGKGLQQLEGEYENLHAALEYSLSEAGSSIVIRLCGALLKFWGASGHLSEGRRWCVRALEKPDVPKCSPERARLLNGAGNLASHLGDYTAAIASYQESRAIYQELGDRQGVASALNNLGSMAETLGDYATAEPYYEQCLHILKEFGDQAGIANLLCNLGSVAYHRGDPATAHSHYQEGLAIRQEIGDQLGVAVSFERLGYMAYVQGDHPAAQSWYEQSLNLFRELERQSGAADILHHLGQVAQAQGEARVARSYYEQSLVHFQQLGYVKKVTLLLEEFAGLAAQTGQSERATVLWGASEAVRKRTGSPPLPGEREAYDCSGAEVRQTLGEEAFLAAWVWGASMTLEQAIEYALQEPQWTVPSST